MATLEEKFTELQGLMTGNHTALLSAIASQQSSLDTIAINSGLQSTALGLIKLDTGGLGGKLDTIVQLLTDLNAATIAPDTRLDYLANLARLETMQDDMLRVRKILATTTQYAASDTGQVSTIFGRLDNSLLQLAGVFVGPDGYFPGSGTTFGGVLASIFLNLVSIEATNSDMREIFDGPPGEYTAWKELNLLRLSASYIQQATETSAIFLGTHTPILEAIRDCTCATPGGGGGTCDPVLTPTGTIAMTQLQTYGGVRNPVSSSVYAAERLATSVNAVSSFDTGNFTYNGWAGFNADDTTTPYPCLIPIPNRPMAFRNATDTQNGAHYTGMDVFLLTPAGNMVYLSSPGTDNGSDTVLITEADYPAITYPVAIVQWRYGNNIGPVCVGTIGYCSVG